MTDDDADARPPEGAPEAAHRAIAFTTARFYENAEAHAAILDGCSREQLEDLATMLAGFLSGMLHSIRAEDGSPVDPAEALRHFARHFGSIEDG